jgi:hypothetical protein
MIAVAQFFMAFITSILSGMLYGGVVAAGLAVLKHARHTKSENYSGLIAWSLVFLSIITILMWIWPFSYFTFLWVIFKNLALFPTVTIIVSFAFALIKPITAIIIIYLGHRLYRRSQEVAVGRPIYDLHS